MEGNDHALARAAASQQATRREHHRQARLRRRSRRGGTGQRVRAGWRSLSGRLVADSRATTETRRVLFVVIIRVLVLLVFMLLVRVRFTQ